MTLLACELVRDSWVVITYSAQGFGRCCVLVAGLSLR